MKRQDKFFKRFCIMFVMLFCFLAGMVAGADYQRRKPPKYYDEVGAYSVGKWKGYNE